MEIIETLCKTIGCSRRILGVLVGAAEPLEQNHRIKLLFELIAAERLYMMEPRKVFDLLTDHVFEDLDGNMDSVATAIYSDKYDLQTLVEILRIAVKSRKPKC